MVLPTTEVPDTSKLTITNGRNLIAGGVGKNAVLIDWQLAHLDPLKGKIGVGSTITLASVDGKRIVTANMVGVYRSVSLVISFEPILTTNGIVRVLSLIDAAQAIFPMKVDADKVGKAGSVIGTIAPNAFVFNLANIGDFVDRYLNYVLLTLSTIAGLSLLAGIIITNAVALAMLEWRRELGILKSVGYTARTVLSEVLIEDGVIGGVGATLAILLVTQAI